MKMKKNGMNDLFTLDEDDMIIPTISDKTNKPASKKTIDGKTCVDDKKTSEDAEKQTIKNNKDN